MSTDTVSDILIRVKNAQAVYHKTVVIPSSKIAFSILTLLKKEGYVETFDKEKDAEDKFDQFKVYLKYDSEGEPLLSRVKKVSTPGRRVYAKKTKLPRVASGLGIAIVSTSQGIMTDREARRLGVGGELLAKIF
ncbi:MAG: 30S ribosomal protein S8 [bacterium]|nr:30S ribosomal protein S8 [bacterium]